MNHLRYYLRWYNTRPSWMVYAARNQNLPVPLDSSVSCPQLAEDESRGGQPPDKPQQFPKIFVIK